jgi:hypothetical protein
VQSIGEIPCGATNVRQLRESDNFLAVPSRVVTTELTTNEPRSNRGQHRQKDLPVNY